MTEWLRLGASGIVIREFGLDSSLQRSIFDHTSSEIAFDYEACTSLRISFAENLSV